MTGGKVTGSGVKIREATLEDINGVLRLERTVATAPHWLAFAYQNAVTGAGRYLLLAEQGGTLAGFAAASMVDDEGELETIVVREDVRGQGIGAALAGQLLAWFAGRGGCLMRLEVRAGSYEAQRLYRRLGFVEAGRRRDYYHDPDDDALILCRQRAGAGEV